MLEMNDGFGRDSSYEYKYSQGRIEGSAEVKYDLVKRAMSAANNKKKNESGIKSPQKFLTAYNEMYQLILKYPTLSKNQLIKYYISQTEEYPF